MAYTVRTADYRYVEWRAPDDGNRLISRELYDHGVDPDESVNAIDHPRHASHLSRLHSLVTDNFPSLR